jgi:hypothetical protein
LQQKKGRKKMCGFATQKTQQSCERKKGDLKPLQANKK